VKRAGLIQRSRNYSCPACQPRAPRLVGSRIFGEQTARQTKLRAFAEVRSINANLNVPLPEGKGWQLGRRRKCHANRDDEKKRRQHANGFTGDTLALSSIDHRFGLKMRMAICTSAGRHFLKAGYPPFGFTAVKPKPGTNFWSRPEQNYQFYWHPEELKAGGSIGVVAPTSTTANRSNDQRKQVMESLIYAAWCIPFSDASDYQVRWQHEQPWISLSRGYDARNGEGVRFQAMRTL